MQSPLDVALLTGGWDRPYAFGIAKALASQGVHLEVIAGENVSAEDFHDLPEVAVLKLRHEPAPNAPFVSKAAGIAAYYIRLVRYAVTCRPRVFHVLWNNKFEVLDRTVLMLLYKALGKKVVLTAHNINAGSRDTRDSWLNRFTLGLQYRLADHIFVHTEKMKVELVDGFTIAPEAVTVIPFGINNSVPTTSLTTAEAKERLGITAGEKTILFFGNIAPYKGLEYLIDAFGRVSHNRPEYRLIVAGRPKQGFEDYWERIRSGIRPEDADRMLMKPEFIPDAETEVYFKAADVLALPYSHIFQSGVLFLGYSFGLPVLAADVGSLKDDIVDGQTGFVFAARNSMALAEAIETYFASDLFKALDERRRLIQEYANTKYSWEAVADVTRRIYAGPRVKLASDSGNSQKCV